MSRLISNMQRKKGSHSYTQSPTNNSRVKNEGQMYKKLVQILQKPEHQRQLQQINYLSIIFKKIISSQTNIGDWNILLKCIQKIQLFSDQNIRKQEIDWLFVIKGKFRYHGMVYQVGQQLVIDKDDIGYLQFEKDSLFAILTHEAKQKAISQSQYKILTQQKLFIRKILFEGSTILNKDFSYFWEIMTRHRLNKNQQLHMEKMDDTIFIVIKGSVNLCYKWKRVIKLRQLGPGAIFSTFLGRYFYKTSQELKNIERNQFFVCGVNSAVIMGFSPDIFYQNQKFSEYKFIVKNVWDLYLDRVKQLKRIIEEVGTLKPQKQQIIKSIKQQIQQKYLKQRCVSVPVAIERRKLRKIALTIYNQKSNRRKIPNNVFRSAQKLDKVNTQPLNPELNIKLLSTLKNDLKKEQNFNNQIQSMIQRSKSERVRNFYTLPDQNFVLSSSRTIKTKSKTQRNLSQYKHESYVNLINKERPSKKLEQTATSFYRFFRPEQFVSKKLRNNYEGLLHGMGKIKKNNQPQKNSQKKSKPENINNKKQYFQSILNEQRIIKLGPKKRLLYKKKVAH